MVPVADMGDTLGFLEFALAFPQVAEHQQSGQAVAKPTADFLEKTLLSGRPSPRIGALVQAEQVRFINLRVDSYCNEGLYAETLCELPRQWTIGFGTELHGAAGSSRRLKHIDAFRIHRQIYPQSEGTGIVRPSILHRGAPCWRFRIAWVHQPRAMAREDR